MDRFAIEQLDIPGSVLMERAGAAAFKKCREKWPEAKTMVVLCGVGNNGGDGFVVARLAMEAGITTTVFQLGDSSKLKGDAFAAAQRLMSVGIEPETFNNQNLSKFDVIIDALLGTGLRGNISGLWLHAIAAINVSGVAAAVLSIDIPSGLHGDTGIAMGNAVIADCTMTFIGVKQGLLTAQAANYCGELAFDNLNLPDTVYNKFQPSAVRLKYHKSIHGLRAREQTAHKGNFGHVVIVGGDEGYLGAVRLAGEAALRTGAGLVSIATRVDHASMVNVGCPELMCHGIATAQALSILLKKASTIVIGPGLGQSAWAVEMFTETLAHDVPLVIDADALNLLAKEPLQNKNWVLTPHPGEAARLLQQSVKEIEQDRYDAISKLKQRYDGVVILKGRGTLIAVDQELTGVCAEGNPGMASGGMGDVLSGIIAGLIAQGLRKANAARLAVCIHSAAADKAVVESGERGLLASDLMPWIRELVNP
ncbi:NAD(P)H-hydrate epimerase / ADP-dependent (S)-NAD(P)H-hydrate dehydratase [hydrothermal vent metagenome]|uniref:Nicotinamide nucleotide repair protein n=1 Tax=hydrothermal vent metagenome TaxID=652676 RepID=A0A3B1AKE0_9ZZZZ